ncbi:MAG TPA: phosphatase PAP2 family protein [Gemmatimonadaceae bacterium]
MKSRFETRFVQIVVALALIVAPARPTFAQQQIDDEDKRSLFTWRDGLLAGGFVVGTIAIRPLDKSAAKTFQKPIPQQKWYLHKAAVGLNKIAVPGAVIIGTSMYAIGRLSKSDRLAQLGLHGTEALFIGEGIATGMKYTFGRARPYVDSVPNPDNWQLLRGFRSDTRYRSFPSGHSVAGFAAAAAVTAETSVWYPEAAIVVGTAMYGGAALIGLARMYDNRHWASDVIMGAAIGTFAGNKVVRYHRIHPNNRIDKWLLNASVTPGDWSRVSIAILPAR